MVCFICFCSIGIIIFVIVVWIDDSSFEVVLGLFKEVKLLFMDDRIGRFVGNLLLVDFI